MSVFGGALTSTEKSPNPVGRGRKIKGVMPEVVSTIWAVGVQEVLLGDGGHPKAEEHLLGHPQVRGKLGHRPCLMSIVPSRMAPIAPQLPLAGVPVLATQSRGPRAQRVGAGSPPCTHPPFPPLMHRGRREGNKRSSHSWALAAVAMVTFPLAPPRAGQWPPVTGPGPLGSPGPCGTPFFLLGPSLSPCSLHPSVCLFPICPASPCPRPGGGQRGGGERWVPQCLSRDFAPPAPYQPQPQKQLQPQKPEATPLLPIL